MIVAKSDQVVFCPQTDTPPYYKRGMNLIYKVFHSLEKYLEYFYQNLCLVLIPKYLSFHCLCLWIPGKSNHVSILMSADNNNLIPSSLCNPESDFYSHLFCCSSLLMNPIPLVSSSVLLAVSTCE